MALVKKREGNIQREKECSWQVDLSYQKFLWLYLTKQFASFKKNVEVRERKGELAVVVTLKENITDFMDL